MQQFFTDEEFQFGLELTLGSAYHQMADVGEALVTAARIVDADSDSWVAEWTATAAARQVDGAAALAAGRPVSALAHFRRAATYYSTALYRFAGASDNSPERELELWRRHRECWEQVVDLMPVPGERIEIPYEDTTLPGYFFRAPHAASGERRPLIVMNNGSDGADSSMWIEGGSGAAARGYHWMTFDGPGQQAALFERGIPFRPDWEHVLGPVLDSMLARSDVDGDHVALIGVSQAGYWVPRALAFEHRFAAAVADGGVVDVARAWLGQLPEPMLRQLRNGERDAFERSMQAAEAMSPAVGARLDFRGRPYGVTNGSRYDLFAAVDAFRLGDEVAGIRTPLLITDPDGEHFFPGQPQELYDRLGSPKELIRFTEQEGAAGHCEPMARALRETRIYDWLEDHLS